MNAVFCQRCIRGAGVSCLGNCECPADVEAAKTDKTVKIEDVQIHCQTGFCRLGYFSKPDPLSEATSKPILIKEEPIPGNKWPRWTRKYVKRRRYPDSGVGDTMRWVYARIGGERWKKFRKAIGFPCKCPVKQARFNRIYPYDGMDGRPAKLLPRPDRP